jgi:hypothetical protein
MVQDTECPISDDHFDDMHPFTVFVPEFSNPFPFFLSFSEQTNPVRGMKDRFGEENRRFKWITDKGANLSNLYGFEQVGVVLI